MLKILLILVLCAFTVCTTIKDLRYKIREPSIFSWLEPNIQLCGSGRRRLATILPKEISEVGFNMYKKLAEQSRDNILFSPLSAQTILALTYMGAEGKTAEEMQSALSLPVDKVVVGQVFQEIETKLKENSNPNVILNTANKIYPAVDVKVKDAFLKIAKTQFHSDVERLHFANGSRAAKIINGWVEKQTNNKIKHLISPTSLSDSTRMILVNALYFNGMWKHKFEDDGEMLFHRSEKPGDTQNVPSMSVKEEFLYGIDKDLDAQLLALPYDNTDYNFLIILPRKINGLATVEKQMPFKLEEVLNSLSIWEVKVRMPKFRIEQSVDFKKILEKAGMNEAFSNAVNFKGIANEPLHIDEVIQKTFMEVNERGTEAAAATGVQVVLLCAKLPSKPFIVDRPFFYILYEKSTTVAIMMGRYVHG